MSRWWRAYDEAVDDPKLILLGDKAHRAWFCLMCVASANGGVLPDIKIVAVKLRTTPQRAAAALAELVQAGLFDQREDSKFEPHNWSARQYKSDVTDPTNADRQKRYRDRKRNGETTVTDTVTHGVTVTLPREQRQTTDTESSLRSDSARKRGTRLPDDWTPQDEDWQQAIAKLGEAGTREELSKFKDYWKAQPGQRGVKLDWDATWRNWIRNAKGQQNHGRRTVQDAARDLHENLLERIAAFDEPPPRGLCDGAGADALRLLPPGRRQ
jgi:hypothetical protein